MQPPSKAESLKRLSEQLESIHRLKTLRPHSPEFALWKRNTRVAIENIFGTETPQVREFDDISYHRLSLMLGGPPVDHGPAYRRGLESAETLLKSMIHEIESYWDDDIIRVPSPLATNPPDTDGNQVFIIHGRDNATKQEVATLFRTLTLDPVILHEQPDRGRTIIEKFEAHSKVTYAVALLTPDDEGRLIDDADDLRPRARQNVIFEFGFFIGRLGRTRVSALIKGGVEIPTDYSGVVYIPWDHAGGWKMKLIRELRAAGFDVDANLAL